MSLVNYGSSDDDDENESDVISETLQSESNEQKSIHSISDIKSTNVHSRPSLSSSLSSLTFKSLTKPTNFITSNSRIQIKAFDDDLVTNRQDSDSDDEDNRARKRMKRSEKGSSLISMLPKPKTTIINSDKQTTNGSTTSSLVSLVPNSVSNRAKASEKTSLSTKLKTVEKESVSNFFFADSDNDDDDADDDDNVKIRMIPKPWLTEDTNNKTVMDLNYPPAPCSSSYQAEEEKISAPIYGPSKPIEQEEQSSINYLDPNDDITYKKYIASKFDDNTENIKIIDVNLNQHLSENKDWLKNISLEKDIVDEALEAKAPNSTAKRKNQITFLAYQAKKRELELKNQWAQNRLSKSQTRAKYGF
ncbi:hypothetical protein DERF_003695 [Dermatophagoides farinae]|uniref:Proline-rich protein PRCC n=1 Tax=Dermatophagoides farinae TaxID=6954 RepID=A0A922IE82_DERFA|nr:hypothetical protein DERF_003695 [Dermatophagoides farinae]